jgi:hypothetical protein
MIVLGMYALNIIHPWCFLFKDAALQRSTSTSSESD